MKYRTTPYILEKDGVYISFESEGDACDFLGVSKCCVASAYRQNKIYHGYRIIKAVSENEIYGDKRLRKIWGSMHERCEYEKHPHYHSYGGRGIYVCDEWDEYIPFAKWAFRNGYAESLTLDRIDNNDGYYPENCRWVTMKEQANNKRTNHYVNIGGELMTVTECAERYGVPKSTVRYRSNLGRDVLERRRNRTGAHMDEVE